MINVKKSKIMDINIWEQLFSRMKDRHQLIANRTKF
jgi:hypothetical protein